MNYQASVTLAKIPLSHLDRRKGLIAVHLFRHLLFSSEAEASFSMVIDGKPTHEAYIKYTAACREDLDLYEHRQPTTASSAFYRSLREGLDPWNFPVKASAAQTMQNTPQDSRAFRFSLIGLVVTMVHDLAVNLYEELHPLPVQVSSSPETPTLPCFFHPKYQNYSVYPRGPVELVGYWMETRVFGGVVVFEYGNPPSLGEPAAAWLHLPFAGVVRLSDRQLGSFEQLGFIDPFPVTEEYRTAGISTILPFALDPDSRKVRTSDAYELGLFRNIYEHQPPPNISNFSCVRRNITYPESFWKMMSES